MTAPPAPYEKARSGGGKIFAIVLAAVLGGGVLLALTCAGAFVGFIKLGEAVVETQVQDELAQPLAPYTGEIQQFDMNWVRTGSYEESDVAVYDVAGTLATGRVVTEHTSDGTEREEIHWAVWVEEGGQPVAIYGEPPEKFLAE